MNYQEFIKPELLILIPVLYFVGTAIKKSKMRDNLIPFILGAVGVVLSGVYLFAAEEISGSQAIATAIFTAFTQGVLCAAASVYANQLIKQALQNDENEKKEIALLYAYLKKGGYTLDELNTELYAIPKAVFGELPEKELKGVQGSFFKNVYRLLIDKERGPRLYLFLYAIDPAEYVGLLDFSYPRTEEEIALDTPVEEACPLETKEENK